jgi:alpha-amylase/alpha-mannosidase (GH57 family)
MKRYICIHGHFYQPPRENPWLGFIELQDSAYPYHDWNERITAECYAQNMSSRILSAKGRITEIVNNYTKISFNFGPTLLAWMEPNAPDIYQAILEADRVTQKTFSGHGSALAQSYNHMILPLANRRDKYTQVLWGIQDFEHRFGRKPEGMWLPETAVNLETLEVLAEFGIKFTILAPRQARRVRRLRSREWQDVSSGNIDPTMAYTLRLPSGRSIALFFYDDPIARAVAFEGLLSKGEQVAQRLIGAFSEERTWPQLVHIATDGETYGHHHRFGDMALAYALHYIESNHLARITNYGEYLEKHPPTHEVEIIDNTSWSCAHGVERWRSDCGCNSGSHPGWNQAWRAPLRESLDWLRDTLAPKYEEKAGTLLKDPWAARDDYIAVILDRSPESVEWFLSQHATRELDEAEKITVLKLLELQHYAMLMYTSCGWFFDELSGIETVQVIQYAGRALQLAEQVFGDAIEPHFLKLLERAKSNIPQHGDGRRIYEKSVKLAMVDLTWVAAHYAISSLFEDYGEQARVYSYIVDLEDYQSSEVGRVKLAVGRVKVFSEITRDSAVLSFGVLHFGDHNLNAGVREYQGEEAYQLMLQEVTQAFSSAEFAEVIRQLDKHFGISTYSLRTLFRDEQRKVLNRILESTLAEVEAAYRQVYTLHYPLMRFLTDLGNPLPLAFRSAAEFILNIDLRRALSSDTLDVERSRVLLDDARVWNVDLDAAGLGYLFGQTLEEMMGEFASTPEELSLLQDMVSAVGLARSLPFEVNLWKVQNIYYEMLLTNYPGFQRKAKKGDETAEEWVTQFISLGEQLSMQIPRWSN